MYTTTVPTMATTGLRSSAVLHPNFVRGMANSIAASTLTSNAVTRTTGMIAPTMMGGAVATNVIGEIQGESRVEYVPYEKTIIEYQPVERTEYVPYERKVIEYEDRKRVEQVPVERTYTDYYAIQHIVEYYPQVIPETKIDYVPVERIENRVQYYPVERQVVHYPDEMLTGSRRVLAPGMPMTSAAVGLSRVASGGITTIGGMAATSRLNGNYPMGIRPSSAYNAYGTGPIYGTTSIPVGQTVVTETMPTTTMGGTYGGYGGAYLGTTLPRVGSGTYLPGVTTTGQTTMTTEVKDMGERTSIRS